MMLRDESSASALHALLLSGLCCIKLAVYLLDTDNVVFVDPSPRNEHIFSLELETHFMRRLRLCGLRAGGRE